MSQTVNFEQVLNNAQKLEVLPLNVVTALMGDVAAGRPPIYDGRRYTTTEVGELMRRVYSGEKVTKISQYRGDYLMTQGALVAPEFSEETKEMEYPVSPAAVETGLPIETLPVRSQLPDLQNVTIGGVRYYLELGLKEDIKFFSTLFSYSMNKAMTKKMWQQNVAPTSFWAQRGVPLAPVSHEILEMITPPMVMSGQSLMEYLYATKSTWPYVQAIVYGLLKEVVVPDVDDEGAQQYDLTGAAYDKYANGMVRFRHGENRCVKVKRIYRTLPINYKLKGDPYKNLMVVKKVMDDVKIQNYLDCNNDYYDGIDYSKNLNDIRSKMIILDTIDFSTFPSVIGVVTGQQEEFAVVERYFGERYKQKTVKMLSQNSAMNFTGFKLFMKPLSSMGTMAIYDKTNVNRAMIEDAALAESIHAGEYPRGMGFMTHLLIAHHARGQEATPKTVPGEVREDIPIDGDAFKQLHSPLPLSFYPYVYWSRDFVAKIPSRKVCPVANLTTHLWNLLNYPYTALPYCTIHKQNSPLISWTPGKTAMDVLFELEGDMKKGMEGLEKSFVQKPRVRRLRVEERDGDEIPKEVLNPPSRVVRKEKEKEPEPKVQIIKKNKIPEKEKEKEKIQVKPQTKRIIIQEEESESEIDEYDVGDEDESPED
jgi:hypothetical protein